MRTKPIKIFLISILILNLSSVRADCLDLWEACDTALNKAHDTISLKDDVIYVQDGLLKKQNERIINLEEDKNAWYNSKTLWFGVGLITGGVVVFKLRR